MLAMASDPSAVVEAWSLNMKPTSKNEFREKVLSRMYGSKVSKSHHKQAVVLDGFAKCLFERGLADTSFSAVAEYCGMKPSHINYYFPTWEDMLETTFRFVIATAQEVTVGELEKAKTPQARLKAMCDAPFLHLQRYPDHAAILTAYQMECTRQKKFRTLQRKIREQGRDRIKEILTQLNMGSGSAKAETLALQIQSTIVGYVTEWSVGRESDSSAQAQKETWNAVRGMVSQD